METCDTLCILKPEQRKEYRENMDKKYGDAAIWKRADKQPTDHHILYERI